MHTNSLHARVAAKQLLLQLNEWTLMAKGEGHIVLHNCNINSEMYWKVMYICIHDIHSHPSQMQQIYHQIIAEMPVIGKNLLKRDFVELAEHDKVVLKQFVKQELGLECSIPEKYEVYIAENLRRSRQGWQYWLQFKPKTALPDKYSTAFMNSISQKTGIQSEYIIKILEEGPLVQKTRWFKKNACNQIIKNMNPLEIFNIQATTAPNMVERMRLVEQVPAQLISSCDERELNNQIIKLIRQSQILTAVARLQLLYTGASDKIDQDIANVWEKQEEKQTRVLKMKKSIKAQLEKEIEVSHQISHLLHSAILQQRVTEQEDRLLLMFKFLISWSWRDVSLIMRFKINHQIITGMDIKIIDYELKEASKLKQTASKDEKFLLNYLRYLRVI